MRIKRRQIPALSGRGSCIHRCFPFCIRVGGPILIMKYERLTLIVFRIERGHYNVTSTVLRNSNSLT
jgi:hypothetical protein